MLGKDHWCIYKSKKCDPWERGRKLERDIHERKVYVDCQNCMHIRKPANDVWEVRRMMKRESNGFQ